MDSVTDMLRLADTFPLDRETVEEHLKTIQTQCDFFPLAASQAEQTIELLNIRRRASLAIAALQAGRLTPRQRTPEPTIVEALPMVQQDEEDGA